MYLLTIHIFGMTITTAITLVAGLVTILGFFMKASEGKKPRRRYARRKS